MFGPSLAPEDSGPVNTVGPPGGWQGCGGRRSGRGACGRDTVAANAGVTPLTLIARGGGSVISFAVTATISSVRAARGSSR